MNWLKFIFMIGCMVLFVSTPNIASANKSLDITDVKGVSLPSFEWACVQYGQVYDFPLEGTVELLQQWNFDTIRLPLNQECWLNDATYRNKTDEVITEFGKAGIDSIIDLHWNAPSGARSREQQVMADAERSPEFWRQIAEKYKNNQYVIAYELYNEPRDISWTCWKYGCTTSEGWQTVGMQRLVDVVREIDDDTWLIVNGLHWANDVQGAIEHRPVDPAGKLAFGWHIYDEFDDPNKCTTPSCFEREIAPLAEDFPIVITEFGSRLRCNPQSHDRAVLDFAKEHDLGIVGWAWYPADCGFPALIKDWSGTPTVAGQVLCAFLGGDCSPIAQSPDLPDIFDSGSNTDTEDSHDNEHDHANNTPATSDASSSGVTSHPICFVSFKHGVLGSHNVKCTGGYELAISGAITETWNDRITSWRTDGGLWIAIAGWDYYTTSGRIEKGNEVWLPNTGTNVEPEANDRVRYLLLRPDFIGSLTVYQDDNQQGPSLTFTLK